PDLLLVGRGKIAPHGDWILRDGSGLPERRELLGGVDAGRGSGGDPIAVQLARGNLVIQNCFERGGGAGGVDRLHTVVRIHAHRLQAECRIKVAGWRWGSRISQQAPAKLAKV